MFNLIRENYCMENVIRNLKRNPENRNDMNMENDKKWVYLVLYTCYELGWIFLRFENMKKNKESHGKTWGNKNGFLKKEKIEFGPKDPGFDL